jgi:hypothetical protein
MSFMKMLILLFIPMAALAETSTLYNGEVTSSITVSNGVIEISMKQKTHPVPINGMYPPVMMMLAEEHARLYCQKKGLYPQNHGGASDGPNHWSTNFQCTKEFQENMSGLKASWCLEFDNNQIIRDICHGA